jgi:hypothetical protein
MKKLEGRTLVSIVGLEVGSQSVIFNCDDGTSFKMYHSQDCCESVSIEDVNGDVNDLIWTPIVLSEEVVHSNENPEGVPEKEYQHSFTWTFYKLATGKGYVTIRWYGESNGYYSEGVKFEEVTA